MSFAPGPEYYGALAQIVPLLLITLVLEERMYRLWHEKIKATRWDFAIFVYVGVWTEILAISGLAFHLPENWNGLLGLAVAAGGLYLLVFVGAALIDVADPDFIHRVRMREARLYLRIQRRLLKRAPQWAREHYRQTSREIRRRGARGEDSDTILSDLQDRMWPPGGQRVTKHNEAEPGADPPP